MKGSESRWARPPQELVPAALLLLAWAYLLWVAATLTVDYYDGIQYILTGTNPLYFHPKSPLLSSLFALVEIPIRGRAPSLTPFHLAVALANMSGLLIVAAWIRRCCPSLGLLEIAAVLTFNRLAVHYMPFALPDLLAAGLVGLWLWVEATSTLSSRIGRLRRAAVLSLFVLGRVHVVLIPAVSLLVEAWRTRRPRAAVEVGLGGAIAALTGVGLFNGLAGKGFFAGFADFLSLARGLYAGNVVTPPASPLHYLTFLGLLLTPAGVLLLLFGLVKAVKRGPDLPSLENLAGPALGALCFLLFILFVWKNQEARYLSPLLPFWALIQCRAAVWLAGKKAWAGTLAIAILFVSVVPEFRHFTQPFYRADWERKAAVEISRWGRSQAVVFAGWNSATMAPERHVFDLNDPFFYMYHWSVGAYAFFTGQPAYYAGPASFSRYGYPILDQLREIAGPGVTIVSPADQTYVTANIPARLPPIYALRWFPKEAGASNCSPAAPEICVQILKVDPREDASLGGLAAPEKGGDELMAAGLKVLYEQKDPVQAQGLFREVLERNPMHYGATFQLAVALDASGSRPAARPVWKQALTLAENYHDRDTAKRIRLRLQSVP